MKKITAKQFLNTWYLIPSELAEEFDLLVQSIYNVPLSNSILYSGSQKVDERFGEYEVEALNAQQLYIADS